MQFGFIAKGIRKAVVDNSAAILTSFAVTGVVATSFFVGRASFKAAGILAAEQVAIDLEGYGQELDTKDKIRLVWREYVPAAAIAALTVAAIVGSNRIGSSKLAALGAAYATAERGIDAYRDKVIEKIGAKKDLEIRNEIAEERLHENLSVGREVIVLKNEGEVFYDMWSGRTFVSDMQSVREAANDVNERVFNDYYVSLSTFYDLLGIGGTKGSDSVGFNPDRKLELVTTTTVSPVDGRPCHAIDFAKEPSSTFQDFH